MPSVDRSKAQNEIIVRPLDQKDVEGIISYVTTLTDGRSSTTDVMEGIISGALTLGVSDVHFEPEREKTRIRFRIDGVLSDIGYIRAEDYKFIISRLKLVGGIKMNVSEMAQDGRFTIVAGEERIEVRLSLNPSEYGETAVMRILDPKNISLGLIDLGLRPDDEADIVKNLKRPNGMILVTGPTGSGKTTALYAFLKSVRSSEVKIITIEDPIEYHLDGVQQTQVDAAAGYTFGNGLRSLLRQDPDVILIGEIRDLDTAEIAIHAALTGHLVFSTLHTNSASGAIPRLIDIGVKPQVIGPSLNTVIAERLVRRLCDHCKKPAVISPEVAASLSKLISDLPAKIDKAPYQDIKLYEPVGCPLCHGGYKGRIGIFEVLDMDDEFKTLIHQEASEAEIIKFAVTKGFVTLQRDGILKAIVGLTNLSEVERATGPIEW